MTIRNSQVAKLLAAKKANDAGKMSDADMLALVSRSGGNEICEAMDRSGQDSADWAAVKGPWRSAR